LRITTASLVALGLAAPVSARAQAALAQEPISSFELTVANIMRGPEHVGEPPAMIRWTDDGRWIYFRWKPGGQPWHEERGLYRVPAQGGTPERLSDEAADSVAPLLAPGDISPDKRSRVVSYDGDLFLIDRRSLRVRRLTDTRDRETSPVFSGDGRSVYFVRGDNLFQLTLADGTLSQLTDVRKGPPRRDREAEGHRAFLETQQKELFEHISREAEARERREARQKAREAARPEPIHIANDENVMGISVEPAGRYALLRVGKPARDARQTMVPDWVTHSGYTEPLNVRAKVGDAQSEARLALVTLATGKAVWLDLVPEAVCETWSTPGDPHPQA